MTGKKQGDDPPKREPSVSSVSRCLFGPADHNQNRIDCCRIMTELTGTSEQMELRYDPVSDRVISNRVLHRRQSSTAELPPAEEGDDYLDPSALAERRSSSEPARLSFRQPLIGTVIDETNQSGLETESGREMDAGRGRPVLPSSGAGAWRVPSHDPPNRNLNNVAVSTTLSMFSYRTVPVVQLNVNGNFSDAGSPSLNQWQRLSFNCFFTPINVQRRRRSLSYSPYDETDLEVCATATAPTSVDDVISAESYDVSRFSASNGRSSNNVETSTDGRCCRPKKQKLMTDFCTVKKFTRLHPRRPYKKR